MLNHQPESQNTKCFAHHGTVFTIFTIKMFLDDFSSTVIKTFLNWKDLYFCQCQMQFVDLFQKCKVVIKSLFQNSLCVSEVIWPQIPPVFFVPRVEN